MSYTAQIRVVASKETPVVVVAGQNKKSINERLASMIFKNNLLSILRKIKNRHQTECSQIEAL